MVEGLTENLNGKRENTRQAGMEPEMAIVDRHLPVAGMHDF